MVKIANRLQPYMGLQYTLCTPGLTFRHSLLTACVSASHGRSLQYILLAISTLLRSPTCAVAAGEWHEAGSRSPRMLQWCLSVLFLGNSLRMHGTTPHHLWNSWYMQWNRPTLPWNSPLVIWTCVQCPSQSQLHNWKLTWCKCRKGVC